MQQNHIETKTITELLGNNFFIPDYQRGYRWTENNVLQLLEDIWEYRQNPDNSYKFYCLQPVVVRKASWNNNNGTQVNGYELIDGQQRLTTIHRILTYLVLEHLENNLTNEGYKDEIYSMYYQTRLESKEFLDQNSVDHSKPDLSYMSNAYETIKNWFENGQKGIPRQVKEKFLNVLLPSITKDSNGKKLLPEWSVQVIYYEINDHNQKSEDLFTRLNRGKIPLTSAELIKAKFVNTDSFHGLTEVDKIKRRTQLVQIWEEIESQLNNPRFWAFISNSPLNKYTNKIEYLFDVLTHKKPNEKDPLYSFIHFFDDVETAETLWDKWLKVEEIYRSLVYWYSSKEHYHKIGYLVTVGSSIGELVLEKKKLSKSEFDTRLDELIADSIEDNWDDLSYGKGSDHEKMIRVLLLTNVELCRVNSNNDEFFPFEMYKRITKSLEHVHAQNIEGINENRKEDWFNWLRLHTSILMNVTEDRDQALLILQEFNSIDQEKYRFEDFKILSSKILDLIPREDINENEFLHKIENMALLGLEENISLSNSVFEVKRRKIIEMDKKGSFIPIATKRIFLKYYTPEGQDQFTVWTQNERNAYRSEIAKCVEYYKLPKLNLQ